MILKLATELKPDGGQVTLCCLVNNDEREESQSADADRENRQRAAIACKRTRRVTRILTV